MLQATMRIRIEWSHCDPAKIIYNPHYYIWMDHCSHSLLRIAGLDFKDHMDDPDFKACPLVKSTAEFHSPAFLADQLLLTSQVSRFGNKSFDISHEFQRDNTLICTGKEIRVWGGTDQRGQLTAQRVPDWIKENLSLTKIQDVSV
ncbi:MAG: thioesterase family protein [Pseudomonadota bacterium]